MCQRLGWVVNLEKSELEPKHIFNFAGYQFGLRASQVCPTPDRWQNLQEKTTDTAITTDLSGPTIDVLDRFANSHTEASSPWLTAYETDTAASPKQLEFTDNGGWQKTTSFKVNHYTE